MVSLHQHFFDEVSVVLVILDEQHAHERYSLRPGTSETKVQ